MEFNLTEIDSVIAKYQAKKKAIIPILQDIQAEYNWLPPETITEVSKKLNIPLIDVYGVATFFSQFSLKPRGKHIITVCLGTACHVRGGPRILDEFARRLNIKAGETTEDMQFTLETVNCLGCCAIGPVVVIDGEYYGGMTSRKVDSLLAEYLKQTTNKNERNKNLTTEDTEEKIKGFLTTNGHG